MKLNLNAPFFQFINTAFDFVVLNICFILTCLPVFTIGAALTALYTVTMAEAEDKPQEPEPEPKDSLKQLTIFDLEEISCAS